METSPVRYRPALLPPLVTISWNLTFMYIDVSNFSFVIAQVSAVRGAAPFLAPSGIFLCKFRELVDSTACASLALLSRMSLRFKK
jgi:hypothetical protein